MAIAIKLASLEAFCQVCPPDREVSVFLEELGFNLVFHMPAKFGKRTGQAIPMLPAQYHYGDTHGTEVIFLAGKDTPPDQYTHFPYHASRWWMYQGSSHYAFNLASQEISKKYRLNWKQC